MQDESMRPTYEIATFAGGCFWCMVQPFEKTEGVIAVRVGYAGGVGENPTYQDYAQKGYIEGVQITYDSVAVSYEKIVSIFWQQIDPTDSGGQFYDRGRNYSTAIFFHSPEQKKVAEESKKALENSGRFAKPIATDILPFTTFYPGEQYHQDYYKKNPEQYESYRRASGRDVYLKNVWGEKSKDNNEK